MAFIKGNTYSNGRPPGSRNKKTIIKESLERLTSCGITPVETSNEIITSLLQNSEMDINQKLKLLNITSSLMKYELLTRAEEIKLDEVLTENEELRETVAEQQSIIADTSSAAEILKQLQQEK